MTRITLLTDLEMESLHKDLPGWEIQAKTLSRNWTFINFIEAFAFITKVAMLAQTMNHHPNLKNIYSTVSIELTTHDLGGISRLDVELAKAINALSKGK